MAVQADIRYVQYRVEGTAARKPERQSDKGEQSVHKRRKAEHKVIRLDPVALAGIVLSAVVLVAMAVGLVQYRHGLQQRAQMSQHIAQLRQENAALEQQYREGYDLEEIRDIALAAGMIPSENASRVRVQVTQPEQPQTEMTFWDSLTTFLAGIFA